MLGAPDFVTGSLDPQNANHLVRFSQVNATTPGFVSLQFSGAAIPDLPGDEVAGGFPSTISFDLAVGLLGVACERRGAR